MIDLLGPLPKTRNEDQFIIVITDRYSKLTSSVPISMTTAPYIASVMLNHCIIPYEIPNSILYDNGPQFVAELWKNTCHILGFRLKTTTAYHPQTNVQAKHYNGTISTSVITSVDTRPTGIRSFNDYVPANFASLLVSRYHASQSHRYSTATVPDSL